MQAGTQAQDVPSHVQDGTASKSEYCKDWRFHPILAAIAIAIGGHFLLFVLRDLLGLEDVLECVTLSENAPALPFNSLEPGPFRA